jgi:HNH endonuclease
MRRPLHIVQGGIENGDKRELERLSVRGGRSSSWIAPKSSAVGDDVIIYIGGYGLFATARIAGSPKKRQDWHNRYGAPLSNIRLIQPPVSLGVLMRRVPQLNWAAYPRSITTAHPRVAAQLRSLVEQRRRDRRPDVRGGLRPRDLSLEELWALAAAGSAGSKKAKRTVTVRLRRAAVKAYVLARAEGECEFCREPAPFLDADGDPFLEAHHITRLADEGPDHPRNGIGICPNCHRRAHHAADKLAVMHRMKKRVASIQRRLVI